MVGKDLTGADWSDQSDTEAFRLKLKPMCSKRKGAVRFVPLFVPAATLDDLLSPNATQDDSSISY